MANVSEDKLLKVSKTTNPKDLGSAIANAVFEGEDVLLRAVGAGAVNQAVKGLIIASSYTAQRAINLTFRAGFQTIASHEGDISAIILKVVVG